MRLAVLLLSRSGLQGWWGKSCLAGPEYEVHEVTTWEEVFRSLGARTFGLCVVESPPSDTGLPSFLQHLRSMEGVQVPKCVIVTKAESPDLEGLPVAVVLRPPFTHEQFDATARGLLDTPARGAMRYLVRPFYASEGISGKALGLGTTVLLTPKGMLVESSNSLPVHKDLVWTFSGVPKLRWLAVRGAISRMDAGSKGAGLRRYEVVFDANPTPERRKLLDYLEESE